MFEGLRYSFELADKELICVGDNSHRKTRSKTPKTQSPYSCKNLKRADTRGPTVLFSNSRFTSYTIQFCGGRTIQLNKYKKDLLPFELPVQQPTAGSENGICRENNFCLETSVSSRNSFVGTIASPGNHPKREWYKYQGTKELTPIFLLYCFFLSDFIYFLWR